MPTVIEPHADAHAIDGTNDSSGGTRRYPSRTTRSSGNNSGYESNTSHQSSRTHTGCGLHRGRGRGSGNIGGRGRDLLKTNRRSTESTSAKSPARRTGTVAKLPLTPPKRSKASTYASKVTPFDKGVPTKRGHPEEIEVSKNNSDVSSDLSTHKSVRSDGDSMEESMKNGENPRMTAGAQKAVVKATKPRVDSDDEASVEDNQGECGR